MAPQEILENMLNHIANPGSLHVGLPSFPPPPPPPLEMFKVFGVYSKLELFSIILDRNFSNVLLNIS